MFFVEGHLYDAVLYPEILFQYVTLLPKNVFSNMALFFGIKVFLLFSNYKENHPKIFPLIHNINLVFLVFNALLFVLSLTLDFQNGALILIREYSNYALYSTLVSFLLAIFYSVYRKNKLAYAFLFSTILLIISVVSVIFNSFGISYFVSVLHLDNISRGFLVQVILLTGFFVYRYKTEKDHFFEEQIKNLEEIEILTLKILNVQEDERKLIARELHDEVGSGLTSIKLMLENYFRKNSSFEEKEMEKKIISTLKTIYEEVRDISHLMMPKSFDELDLKTALNEMILLFQSNNTRLLYTFNCECDFEIVEKTKQIHLYRIIGEIIQNATKHANATQIDIQIYFENKQIEICIEDNGTGITEKKTNGIGLINVQTRTKFLKGIYNCDSNSNGTVFIIQIPI
jgi:signal transduction histidine kinase